MTDLSVVIPVYNEGDKIQDDIEAVSDFLEGTGMRGEIIIVDDGSVDNTVKAAQEASVADGIAKEVISYGGNRGKGYAVRYGINKSLGRYVMFVDSGLCVPFADALKGIRLVEGGKCHIANGSRKLPESNVRRWPNPYRRLLSWLFRQFVVTFLGIPRRLSDTQCGFKIYQGDVARELYAECGTEGFLFDIEIILLALKKGYLIREFPVEWHSDPDTRVLPHRIAPGILNELFEIKKRVGPLPQDRYE